MKQIEPIQIWHNGQLKQAEVLSARIINDDLATSSTFYWTLREADIPGEENQPSTPGQQLAEGNVTVSGQDYLDWDGSNDTAYEFVAEQINVEIVTV
jgi:hypothetical protein